MHSFLFRANTLVTLAATALAILCLLASATDYVHQASPTALIKVAKVERFGRWPAGPYSGNDEVGLVLDVSADLTSIFTWNTKQLFVFICAEYETPNNSLNQVSLWDRVIEHKDDAKLRLPYNRSKYYFIDQGNNLKGRPFNLTLYWNVMPVVGGLYSGKKIFSGFTLPSEYLR